jgi:hypothetical protein
MLFGLTVDVYSEHHKEPINTLCEQNRQLLYVKSGCTFNYHCALKSYEEFKLSGI